MVTPFSFYQALVKYWVICVWSQPRISIWPELNEPLGPKFRSGNVGFYFFLNNKIKFWKLDWLDFSLQEFLTFVIGHVMIMIFSLKICLWFKIKLQMLRKRISLTAIFTKHFELYHKLYIEIHVCKYQISSSDR